MNNSKKRRNFIKKSTLLGLGLPLLSSNLMASVSKGKLKKSIEKNNPNPLSILILGGTSFLGPHQIAYALQRGHSVSTFTRGKTQPTVHKGLFNNVEQLVGDRENDLTALEKGTWDVVIDNSGRKVEWTKNSAALLKDIAKLYIYTSSTGVYYPYLGNQIDEGTKVLTTVPEGVEDEDLQIEYGYGVMKANSEIETIKAFGADRSLLVRPTYMMGPADRSDRFIYWPIRLSRGGEIMVPGKTDDPVQYIDVRDVAEWMIRSAEENRTGTFNVAGPKNEQSITGFVDNAKQAFNVNPALVQIDDYRFLKDNGVHYIVPWIMPEGNNYGSARINNQKAIGSGLTFRNVKDSVKDTYRWWMSDALTDERRNKFEQKPDSLLLREKAILENWKKFKE